MINLIRNPNINSNHLFRADISLDCPYSLSLDLSTGAEAQPRIKQFSGFDLKRVMIRKLIPRNMLLDKPLDQTCLLYERTGEREILSLVTYLPHISSASESPFYHPAVHGIGFLHTWHPDTKEGSVSMHYSFFDDEPRSEKLERTSQHLLTVLHKHGHGTASGYVKRVHHDCILPQAAVQNTYARLKAKYGRILCEGWVEDTDPGKHVFEDLSIAAFLIELWAEMYKDSNFPGFVDIGCGNGLLVHLLIEEGYSGWGFDARKRRSWLSWSEKAQVNLKELVMIPSIIQRSSKPREIGVHDGIFEQGTFIISNHADELTPWTPILATLNDSPFLAIPCCSHALSGSRFRAPPPKGAPASISAYASLVAFVSKLAGECGWEVEKDMLRIPSTRNAAILGRRRNLSYESVVVDDVVAKYGGAADWEVNAMKLVKGSTRGH